MTASTRQCSHRPLYFQGDVWIERLQSCPRCEIERLALALQRISKFETDKGPVPEDDRGGALAAYAARVLTGDCHG